MEDKVRAAPTKCSKPKELRGLPLDEIAGKFTCTNPDCPCAVKEKTSAEL